MSFKTKLGMSDGIRSTKAFLTSVTPHKNEDLNLNFTVGDATLSPKGSTKKLNAGPRKVFGANAFLER